MCGLIGSSPLLNIEKKGERNLRCALLCHQREISSAPKSCLCAVRSLTFDVEDDAFANRRRNSVGGDAKIRR